MTLQPPIESRLRFFDQQHARQAGCLGGFDGELPCNFIKRCGQGQHNILLGKRMLRMRCVPHLPNVRQSARAGSDWRQLADAWVAMPRQKRRAAINAVMAKPTLGRSDLTTRLTRSAVAGQCTHDMIDAMACDLRQRIGLFGRRFVVKGWQNIARFASSEIDPLWNQKRTHRMFVFAQGVDEGDRAIGCTQVDTDDVATERCSERICCSG